MDIVAAFLPERGEPCWAPLLGSHASITSVTLRSPIPPQYQPAGARPYDLDDWLSPLFEDIEVELRSDRPLDPSDLAVGRSPGYLNLLVNGRSLTLRVESAGYKVNEGGMRVRCYFRQVRLEGD